MTAANPSDGDSYGTWHWLRVYYFEACKDELVLDAVWPALRKMAAHGDHPPGFFQRDWVGGPNVLVGVDPARTTERLRGDGADIIRNHLREHPSRSDLTIGEFRAQMASVALRELRPRLIDSALQSNNTLLTDCAPPIAPLRRDCTMADEELAFLCRSAEIVVPWLRMVRDGTTGRAAIAEQVLIALAWVGSPDGLTASASFYSHSHGFLGFTDRDGRLARQFAQRDAGEDGQATRQLLQTTLASLRSSTGLPPGMTDFVALLRRTLPRLRDAVESGAIARIPFEELKPTLTYSEEPERAAVQRRLQVLLNESAAMRAWQITVNFVYLMLNQLGVRPLERILACYLLASATATLYGVQPEELAYEMARTGDPTRMVPFFASPAPDSSVHADA